MDGAVVFNRWRQCALPPDVFTWAHPSTNPKRHLDRFSRFCTARGRASLYFTMDCQFPPQNCQFPWGNPDPHLTNDSLGPLEPKTQTKSQLLQPFLHSSLQSVPILHHGPPLPPQNCPFLWEAAICGPHLIHGSFGPPSPQPKRHLDKFSCFCRAHYCDRHTD